MGSTTAMVISQVPGPVCLPLLYSPTTSPDIFLLDQETGQSHPIVFWWVLHPTGGSHNSWSPCLSFLKLIHHQINPLPKNPPLYNPLYHLLLVPTEPIIVISSFLHSSCTPGTPNLSVHKYNRQRLKG